MMPVLRSARRLAAGLARALVPVAAAVLAGAPAAPVLAGDLVHTIAAVKPSIVAIGSYLPTRSPAVSFQGTGFVTGDGLDVVTNAHVVPAVTDSEHHEQTGVLVGTGEQFTFRAAVSVRYDRAHDLAVLRLAGPPLPALPLGDAASLAEGMPVAFTGFPLGMVLGLQPVTHRATISAITPIVIPATSAKQLDARALAQLHRPPISILQLDGTAYPGNSGSPVYDPDTGAVLGVINMVFVKGLKETAITAPSGITYAIPVQFVHELLQQK